MNFVTNFSANASHNFEPTDQWPRNLAYKMYIWCSLLAGLALLPILLKSLFPYLRDDCCYMWRSLKLGARLTLYKRLKPFYSILDRFLETAKKHPTKTFLHFEGNAYSYSEVDRRSNQVARALQNHAGLQAGAAVALLLGNEPGFVVTWLGLAKLGCSAALLNTNIRAKALLHCFSCCGAKVLIASAGRLLSQPHCIQAYSVFNVFLIDFCSCFLV